jgi:hypothetical protein
MMATNEAYNGLDPIYRELIMGAVLVCTSSYNNNEQLADDVLD